jgi:hypothetical protein
MNASTRASGRRSTNNRLASLLRNATMAPLRPAREQRAGGGAGHGQEHALGQELATMRPREAPMASRTAIITLARAGAGQHDVREVRAGDEEHERSGAQERPQRGLVVLAQPGGPVPAERAVRRNPR